MSIIPSELVLYQSQVPTVGGKISSTAIVSGSRNTAHTSFSDAQRLAGAVQDIKLHFKVDDAQNGDLTNVRIFLDAPTPGDSYAQIYAGTRTDLIADHPAPRLFSVGNVVGNVALNASTFDVTFEADAAAVIQAGDTIVLKDASAYEFLTVNTVSVTGLVATVTTTSPTLNAYTAPRCASCITLTDIKSGSDTYAVTSATGTLDNANNPVLVDNIAGVDDAWTILFSSPTAYSVTGAAAGAAGFGISTVNSTVSNPDYSRPYMTIPAALFQGVFAAGDTVTFNTSSASAGFFSRLTLPANSAPIDPDKVSYCLFGE